MRPLLVYTALRLGLFGAALAVLYLLGARTFLLLAGAFVISGLASYVLLSKQRDAVSARITEKRRRDGEN